MLSAGMSSTDSMSSASQRSWPGPHRRERDAAVAEHDRRDAVPARRRRVGIPRELRVEVRVDVDEARASRTRRRRRSSRRPRAGDLADLDDPVAVDRDVAGEAGARRCRRRPFRRGSRDRGSWTEERSRSVAWRAWCRCSRHASPRSRKGLADARLSRRRGSRDVDLPRARGCSGRCCSRARPASARPRSRRCSPRWTGGELVRLQCYEGIDATQAVYEWDYARQLLHLRAVEASGARDRRGRALLRAVPREAAAAARARARRRRAAGAADRRGRPRRRRVRGVPARDPLRLDDLGARARRGARRRPADRRAHLEPHPRRARRAEAPLPLPLDRASRLRARARDHPAARARGARARSRATSRPRSRRCAGSSSTSRRASRRRSTGRSRSRRSARARLDERSVDATLGTILKYHEDQERVRAHGLAELVRAAVARGA